MINKQALENLLEPRAAKYYAKVFDRIEKHGWLIPTWNWGCFFFSGFWMLYRKLGVTWFLYIVVLALVSRFLVVEYGFNGFYFFYLPFAKIFIPMYANAYMYWKVSKYTKKIYAKNGDPTSIEHRYALASISQASADNPKISI